MIEKKSNMKRIILLKTLKQQRKFPSKNLKLKSKKFKWFAANKNLN